MDCDTTTTHGGAATDQDGARNCGSSSGPGLTRPGGRYRNANKRGPKRAPDGRYSHGRGKVGLAALPYRRTPGKAMG